MSLTEPEVERTREIIDKWPKVEAALDRLERARESLLEWFTGVLARNPKLSHAINTLATVAIMGAGGLLSGWFTPPPVAPPAIERKAEPEAKKDKPIEAAPRQTGER